MARKIVYSVAACADGFIVRPDGSVDWLDFPESAGDYGMAAFFRTTDTAVVGRKTWDRGLDFWRTASPGRGMSRGERGT